VCLRSRRCSASSNAEIEISRHADRSPRPVPVLTDPTVARQPDEPVLRVRGLTKSFGATRVVNDVSFDLRAGEVLTLLGPSGCGRAPLRLVAGSGNRTPASLGARRLVASARPRHGSAGRTQGRSGVPVHAIWPHGGHGGIGYPLTGERLDATPSRPGLPDDPAGEARWARRPHADQN
jgi:hypothetical protein